MHRLRCRVFTATAMVSAVAASADSGLIAEGATLQTLGESFEFTEGPAADAHGNVYFSDIPANLTYKWSTAGELSVARKDTGAANGLIFDSAGNLLSCEGGRGRVTSTDKSGKVTVIADKYNGNALNSPNDLWIDPKGGVYFTDPNYGDGTKPLPQDGEHVYYVSPDRKTVTRVVGDMEKPNGVIGTPDGKTLYVADTQTGKVYVFDIRDDATLSPKREFAPQGSDGMTMDEKNNLYLTWLSGVAIYNPQGERIEVVKCPQMPANAGFGGEDGKTLFVTARTGLYSIRMNVRGQRALP